MKIFSLTLCLLLAANFSFSQEPDKIYMPNISGVKLFRFGNQDGYPLINLGAASQLELHFDDLKGGVKTYNYTFMLCNEDWQPANLSVFDYIDGFSQGRLGQYRASSVAKVKYTHYQALLPEKDCMPKKSGNYLLKVYVNGDTSKLAFTRRILIVSNTIPIGMKVGQPFNSQYFLTHQKVQFTIDVTKLNLLNQRQQLKVVVLQNYRWDNAVRGIQPVFMRGNSYEYNGEQDCLFPAGKEYRWADLRSFRFLTERVEDIDRTNTIAEVYLRPDAERTKERFIIMQDYDGFFTIDCSDANNPWWQGDYGNVHFTFVPANLQPYPDKDVYVVGQMTDYHFNDSTKMTYNTDKGVYEKTLLLKQGFYSYTYMTKDTKTTNASAQTFQTDGDYWETQNTYTVLVYYQSLSGRHDELVGAFTVNSRTGKNGF